jgi:RND family efflux transporter MFP subunit
MMGGVSKMPERQSGLTLPLVGRVKKRTALLLIALTPLVAACQDQQAPPIVRPVLSVVARDQTTETIGPFAGSIEPRYTVPLGFQVFGRLVARDVKVGDVVKKGARLAALDPAVQTVSVRSAQASLVSAEAQLATALAAEERQRTLLDQRVVAPAQFEVVQRNRETAAANVTQAKDRLAKADAELGYTQLYATVDGVITSRSADVGQVVTAGQTIVTIARPEVREAVIDVPDAIASALPPGATFTVTWELDPSFSTTGRVREVAPEADPTTRTRRLRLTLENPPDVFLLGTTVLVSRTVDIPPRINLPITALLERDGKTLVWVVDPRSKTVALREIKVASRDGNAIVVASGVAAGDRVVIAGVHSLAAGQSVIIPEAGS